jgi:lipopolysaccharide export system protein LptA
VPGAGLSSRGRAAVGAIVLAVGILTLGSVGAGSVAQSEGGSAPQALPSDTTEEADTTETERARVKADSLSTLTQDGERVQKLFGDVQVRQGSTQVRSRRAVRYLQRAAYLFTGDVVIVERGDTLRADTVRYNEREKIGRARGRVRLTDGTVRVRSPRATYYADAKRSEFEGGVQLEDSTTTLTSQQGTYFSDAERAEFAGDVQLTEPRTYLEADSITYWRADDRSLARGRVFINRQGGTDAARADTSTRTFLFGEQAYNERRRRYSRIDGRALLVQVRADTAGGRDTLLVRARKLETRRQGALRRLIAIDSVQIWQPRLAAVADSVVYDRYRPSVRPDSAQESAPRPDGVAAASDSLTRPPDSLRSGADDKASLSDTSAVRPATASRSGERGDDEAPAQEETRLFRGPSTWFQRAQVSGDTIRVRARNRSVDTIFVRGSAFAAQEDSALGRIHQLSSPNMTAYFRRDTLRRIVAAPNARTVRFRKKGNGRPDGALQFSADRIVARFREEQIHRMSAVGGMQGKVYTEKTLPDPLRLDGFVWTPEREPTKAALMQTWPVQIRLRTPASRGPLAQGAAPDAPADTQ